MLISGPRRSGTSQAYSTRHRRPPRVTTRSATWTIRRSAWSFSQLRESITTYPPGRATRRSPVSASTIAPRPAAWTSEFPTHSTTSNRSLVAVGRSAHLRCSTGIASRSRRNRAAAASAIASLPSAAHTVKPRRESTAASMPVPQAASSTVLAGLREVDTDFDASRDRYAVVAVSASA